MTAEHSTSQPTDDVGPTEERPTEERTDQDGSAVATTDDTAAPAPGTPGATTHDTTAPPDGRTAGATTHDRSPGGAATVDTPNPGAATDDVPTAPSGGADRTATGGVTAADMPAPHEATVGGASAHAGPGIRRLRWWREVVYIVLVYVAYSAVRNQFGSGAGDSVDPEPAFHHGEAIIQLQRNIGLYFEDRLQQWYLDLPLDGLIRLWNVYYGVLHFVVAAFALVWLFRKAPENYRVWRNTLAFTTLLALIGFATFSLMPPRLMDDPGIYGGCQVYADATPDELAAQGVTTAGDPPCDTFGFVDTIAVYGGWASFGSEEMAAVSNQYAAMPSMHIGWSTWCALVLAPLLRRRWLRWLAIAYPVLTLFCIIVTGNHYWIDGVGGLICLGVGYLIARGATTAWEARRGTVTAQGVVTPA